MLKKSAHIVSYIDGQDNYRDLNHAKECLTAALAKIDEEAAELLDFNVVSIYPPLIGTTHSIGIEVKAKDIALFLSYVNREALEKIASRVPEDLEASVKRRRCKIDKEQEVFDAILRSVPTDG